MNIPVGITIGILIAYFIGWSSIDYVAGTITAAWVYFISIKILTKRM